MFENIKTGLIKNFYIIGIDSDKILDEKFYLRFKNLNEKNKQSLNQNLHPKILSKIPKKINMSFLNEEILIKHCFPNDEYLKIENVVPSEEKIFFELDNFFNFDNDNNDNYNFDNNNDNNVIYVSALIFYESVQNYYNLMKEYQNNNNNNSNNNNNNIYINYYLPKVILITSCQDFSDQIMEILEYIYFYYKKNKDNIIFPIENIIIHLFKIPFIPRGLKINFYLDNKKNIIFEQNKINSLLIPNVSLEKFYDLFSINDILKILKCLLLEIPILIFSENKLKLTNFIKALKKIIYPFKYCQCNIEILPKDNYSLIKNLKFFLFGINKNLKNFNLKIYNKFILLVDLDSIKIIDIEEHIKKNNNINNNINNNYNKNYKYNKENNNEISYENLYEYINKDYNENNNENIYCDFYEDNNDNILEENDFSQENFDFNVCELPSHYKKKLEDWIKNYQKVLKNNNNINEKKIEFESKRIYEFFFYFFVSILKDYNNYLNTIDENCILHLNLCNKNPKFEIDINKIFNIQNFISNVSSCDKPFYYLFFRTKLFKNFIMKKICPKNIIEKLEILYFDERIIEKNNKFLFKKKSENIFINSNLKNDKNEVIIKIEKIINNFNFNNLNEPYEYFQIFTKNKNNNKFIIKYPIFPKLLIDGKFFNEKKSTNFYRKNYLNDYLKKFEEFYENILKNNSNYSDYSINYNHYFDDVSNNFSDFIDLNWIILLSLSYNYIKTNVEKKVAFQLLISKIQTLNFLPNEILIFIYKIFLKYNDYEQIIIIYEIINNNLNLRNNYTLFNELIINLNKNINLAKLKRTYSYSSRMSMIRKREQLSHDNLQISTIEKRGLFNNENNIKETFIFEDSIKCHFCNKYLKLKFTNIIENNLKENNIICDFCNKKFKPNMFVKINDKIKNFEFLNPFDLFKEIFKKFIYNNNKLEFNINNFYKENFQIFWNAIFIFMYKKLNYEFLFPYLHDIKNNNSFKEKGYKNLIITYEIENYSYVANYNNFNSIAGTQQIYKNMNISDFSLNNLENENNKTSEINNDDQLNKSIEKIILFKNK